MKYGGQEREKRKGGAYIKALMKVRIQESKHHINLTLFFPEII